MRDGREDSVMGRSRERKLNGNSFNAYANLPFGQDLDNIIAEASNKPPYVSDARWRIELARRKNKKYYDGLAVYTDHYQYFGARRR